MRLTLRTLLAYLDDTLEPAATKEIGQKLAETPAAQELVSRIREVTRRRRLSAPPVAGDDVDPNTMAEYLDSLLPADLLTRMEGLCLDSEIHLAEAAACHQVLTMIGQPAQVSPQARQRMYDLVHSIESVPADRRAGNRSAAQPAQGSSVFAQRPLLARWMTTAAVLLGVIGIGFLVWVSLNPKGREEGTSKDGQLASEPSGHFIPKQVKRDDEIAPPVLPPEESVAAANQPTPAANAQLPEGETKSEPRPADPNKSTEPMPETPPAVKSETSESEPKKPESTSTPQPVDPGKEKPAEPTKPDSAPAVPLPVLASYASTSGVLLRLDESGRDWRRIPTRTETRTTEVKAKDALLCLPSFRALLQLSNGPAVEMVGETELAIVPADEGTDAHLKLDRGRLVLATNNERATFQIDFLDQTWRINMKGPEIVVGMSLTPVWKPGGPFAYEAAVLVPRGEIEVVTAKEAHQLGGPVRLRWNSATGMRDKESLSVPVAWLEKEEMTMLVIKASESLADALHVDSPLARPLVDATENQRSKEIRLLGVQCLGAIGRLSALTDAMNSLDRRDVRQATIATLRQYMARGPQYEEALFKALYAKFNKSEIYAQGALDLLKGYSDAEFKQMKAKEYSDLIELLSPEKEVCIRELAIMNLEDLAGKPTGSNYDPGKPRESDIAAWTRALKEGRLPPKARGKM